jgi:hypothetical protein
MYKEVLASDNCHRQMNNQNFEKDKFLPSIPEKSVVTFNSAPYDHNTQDNFMASEEGDQL